MCINHLLMESLIVETDSDLLNVIGHGGWNVSPRCPFERPVVPAAEWRVIPDAYSSVSSDTVPDAGCLLTKGHLFLGQLTSNKLLMWD